MLRKFTLFFGCFTLFIFLWEWSARSFPNLLFVLPAPSKILLTLWEMRHRFYVHTCVTLKEMCCGFLLALSLAFPLAWTMMRFHSSRSLLQPLFILIQCTPMFALAPIMVTWFGWGYTAIIIPTALMIFFPLTLNIYQGLRSTPKELLEFFMTNQATPWQTFYKLRLPWALPHIFAGFRISSAIAGVSAVAGEWAGAQTGLGIFMLESRRNCDLEITFGALLCLMLVSISLYGIILYCEKIILPPRHWKRFFKTSSPALPKGQIKKTPSNLLPLFLLCFLFCSCQRESKENNTRLLLDWLPNPNHIPLYVGLEKKFFEEEGITLSIQKMHEGGEGISYLTSKKADLLINHMPGTLKACEHGAQLKIVGLFIKEPLCGLIYRDNPAIKHPQDLNGKVLGYCIGVPDIGFLNFLLARGRIIPCKMKNVSTDLVTALCTKQVDFIYGGFWNIEPAQLDSLGVKTKTFKLEEFDVPPYYEMILLANADSREAKPEYIARFQRALQKSLDYCQAHPEEAFNCFIAYNQDHSEKTLIWEKESWKVTCPLLAKDQIIDPHVVEAFYFWQLKEGIIEKPFDYQKLIQFSD